MEWRCCAEVGVEIPTLKAVSVWDHFLEAVNVWIARPHVLNKRIATCNADQRLSANLPRSSLEKLLSDSQLSLVSLEQSLAGLCDGADLDTRTDTDVVRCTVRHLTSKPLKGGDIIRTSELAVLGKPLLPYYQYMYQVSFQSIASLLEGFVY